MASKNTFGWYDLMTKDLGAAKAFYTEVIGWKTEGWEGGEYTMWRVGDCNIGGLMKLPEEAAKMGAPPSWLGYVMVDDIDATLKRVPQLGGQVHKGSTDIPNVGKFAIVADPQGASFALFQGGGGGAMEMPKPGTPGTTAWHELNTTDYESAWKFYSSLFGWTESSQMDMGPMGKYFIFKPAGAKEDIGGMSNVAKHHGMPPHWLFYVSVDDLDGAIQRIESKGGKILNGPMEVPGGGRIAQCLDPQGAAFAIHQGPRA